ncbi:MULTISPECIES: hypothetical protein [unclassified Modestobacter]|uniref:hypothetical protein n=1 Tax=unclassified Modestobacter TaxID=2643866 RepID=UPI0022AAF368|nr:MULTISPECIES: hypothetical protein [unclassified Modestobacter]MCZ2813413.1 hypothetical protein [Modestobacter sp. VKM Ac-2979]MCZ2842395.1 hypothetical protein [Modestobacter sp. VKM Ac-2980]MCZ2846573.1 hypothetical protein [Modestobacter sp. VKM Ac-2978]
MPRSRFVSPRKSASATCRAIMGGGRSRWLALAIAFGCLVPVTEAATGAAEPVPAADVAAPAPGQAAPAPIAAETQAPTEDAVKEATGGARASASADARADSLAASSSAPAPAPAPAPVAPRTEQVAAPAPAAPAPVKVEQVAAPAPAPATTTSGAALSWAPPAGYANYPVTNVTATDTLTTVSGRGGDVLIKLPTDRAVGPITIADCRNAVIIGGSIRALPSAKVAGHDQRAIYVRNCTGTVHIEGVHIDGAVSGAQTDGIAANAPKAILQIQNVRVDGLRGMSTGNHADVFQPWGGLREYRIDRLTGSSNFQGLHIFENTGPIGSGVIRNTNISGHNDAPVDKGGYYIWTDCNDDYPIMLDGVYVAPRPGRPFGQSVWPSVTHKTCAANVANGVATWPKDSMITGSVREGRPSSGDFVPAGSVGRSYTSPGYR